jgi:hypothetical protein
VRLTTAGVAALRDHLERQMGEMEGSGSFYKPSELVFANKTGGTINPPNLRNRSFARLLKRAKLSETTRSHDLGSRPSARRRQR